MEIYGAMEITMCLQKNPRKIQSPLLQEGTLYNGDTRLGHIHARKDLRSLGDAWETFSQGLWRQMVEVQEDVVLAAIRRRQECSDPNDFGGNMVIVQS